VSNAQQAVRHFQRAEQFFHNLFDEAQVLTELWLMLFLGIADLASDGKYRNGRFS
jgi:hypothetical protein